MSAQPETVPVRAGRQPRSLAQRLAWWIAATTAASLLIFAALAYLVTILQEEAEPEQDTPEVIASEARHEVGDALLVAGPVCLVLAVTGALVLTRRALRPLDQVIHAAARITPRELDLRLPVPQVEDEVRAAVLALNDLLERLESGFNALDRFAADASHELRTPLAVVATELEVMLQSSRSSGDWETSARTCLDEVRHLGRLVDALLRMARAEQTTRPPTEVDLELMIENVLAALNTQARERNVRLEAAAWDERGAAAISGDADALASALTNIVDNAIRYTPEGGEVLVSCARDGEGKLHVHVDDTGPGVSDDDCDRIFEAFTRGTAGRRSSTGFGLGLAIARRVCERNGATIHVGRSPRGGARFSLTFAPSPEP